MGKRDGETRDGTQAGGAETAHEVAALWRRIEAWFAAQGVTKMGLGKPANPKHLAKLEKAIGRALPDDLRASLLLHDGQGEFEHPEQNRLRIFPGIPALATCAEILEQWKAEREEEDEDEDEDDDDDESEGEDDDEGESEDEDDDEGPSEDGWFHLAPTHPHRIPFAGAPYWDGDNAYLDYHPGPNGTAGQVLVLVSECDLVVVAKSYLELMRLTVERLESGVLCLSNGWELERTGRPFKKHPAEELAIADGTKPKRKPKAR